jgi:hypothetical protein
LASRAARAGGDPAGDDPAQAALRAIRAAAMPCLALPQGLVFDDMAQLRDWLHRRGAALQAALEAAEEASDWVVTLAEDGGTHAAWLTARDPGLQRLQRSGAPDRLAQAQQAARAARCALICTRLETLMARLGPARPMPGSAAWTLTVPQAGEAALRRSLALEAAALHGTGLRLILAGPAPAGARDRLVGLDS